MSGYLECYKQVSTERSKMGSDHSVKQSWTCHTNLAEQCDRLWQSLSFFRLVRVRADQKFDLRRVHPLLKCWAQISLRFWLILVCMYVAKTVKYLCSDSLGTERLFIECFNDRGCFSDPSITVQMCPMVFWRCVEDNQNRTRITNFESPRLFSGPHLWELFRRSIYQAWLWRRYSNTTRSCILWSPSSAARPTGLVKSFDIGTY